MVARILRRYSGLKQPSAISGYSLSDYKPVAGQPAPKWDAEKIRVMCIDVQVNRLVVIIRVFGQESSRLLHYEEVSGWPWHEIARIAESYDVDRVGIDCGFSGAQVHYQCSLRIKKWIPLRGASQGAFKDSRDGRLRPWRKVRQALTGLKEYRLGAWLWVHEWSNTYFKDILSVLYRSPEKWQLPDDVGQDYLKQLQSERKDPKTKLWVRIGHRDNHFLDAECMALYFAYRSRLLPIHIDYEPDEPTES